MDNTSTLILGASCGLLCVAGSYLILNMGSFPSKAPKTVEVKKEVNDDKLFPAGKLFIYFGSQTGTAEGFAKVIEKEGIARGFNAKKFDLEDFDPSQLADSRLAVFLMATYGEGEHTDNSLTFSNWMKNENNEERTEILKDISYSVFGLGNRQYEHFNMMGKRTDTALGEYGGTRLIEIGLGDDDGTLEDDFELWRSGLWPVLLEKFHPNNSNGSSGGVPPSVEQPVQLTYRLVTPSGNLVNTSKNHPNKPFFQAKSVIVTANRELRNVTLNSDDNNAGSTRCIELDLVGAGLTYNTADNLAVLPENDERHVAALAVALGYPLEQLYSIQHIAMTKETKDDFPSPFTAKDALTRFLDIEGSPRASTLEQLLPYISDDTQKDWLRKLVAKDNREAFKKYIEGQGKTLFELLTGELKSIKIPLEDFMHIVPHMQPRYYTISSSSSVHPESVHITVAVTEMSFTNGSTVKKAKGLCSSYLQGLTPCKSSCRVYVRPSTFRLPALSTSIVMIGPGTGIAPMRALLQERKYQGATGRNTLYFGCKNRTIDYIYKDEIEEYSESQVLTSLHLAFSREQKEKIYVQQLILQPANGKALVNDLDNKGHLYVCGGTAMGADVMEAVIDVLMTHKQISRVAATDYLKKLQDGKRYVQELWSTG